MSALATWLARQEATHPRSIDLGLGRIAEVARALKLGKPAPRVITVAGTNGKGSTVALLEQLLIASGTRVGTFTSPHLSRYNERIHIDGCEADDAQLVWAFERIERARGAVSLTFFEYNALAAFLLMQDAKVDVAVLEVGLGGRLDAVNLIDADAVVLCSVGLDHREWLGETLEKIGVEKVGVLRAGAVAVLSTAEMPRSLYDAAFAMAGGILIAGRDYFWRTAAVGAQWDYCGVSHALSALALPALEGEVQLRNASAALAALEALGLSGALTVERVSTALRAVRLPGRFERISDEKQGIEWILDVAHNAPAAHELALRLGALAPARTIGVAGILADKDAAAIVAALGSEIDVWIFCGLDGARGSSAAELAARTRGIVAAAELRADVADACARARELAQPGDRIVVFGSFHSVGPAREFLRLY